MASATTKRPGNNALQVLLLWQLMLLVLMLMIWLQWLLFPLWALAAKAATTASVDVYANNVNAVWGNMTTNAVAARTQCGLQAPVWS